MAHFTRSLLVFVVFLFTSSAFAQLITGPIAGGMGGAGRAAVEPGEVTYLNPASLAHLQRYYMSLHWNTGNHESEGDKSDYGLLLADGLPDSIIPGAFGYTRQLVEAPGVSGTVQDFAVTFAGFPMRAFSFGLTGHHMTFATPSREDTQDNAHLGILTTPMKWLGVGVVVYDVLNVADSVPAYAKLNRTYAIGTQVLMSPDFHIRLDASQPERQTGYQGRRTDVMAGLETYFLPEWAFRLGTQWRETRDQTNVTVGFGYKGPRLSFDYSFQKDVRAETGARHLVDLWLPL